MKSIAMLCLNYFQKYDKLIKYEYEKDKLLKCPIKGCVNDTWHHHYLCKTCNITENTSIKNSKNCNKKSISDKCSSSK